MRSHLLTFAVALVAGLSCKPKPTVLPLCKFTVAGDIARESVDRILPFEHWIELMVRGYDRSTHMPPEVLHNCTGREVTHTQFPDDCPDIDTADLLPPRPFQVDDVVIIDTPDYQQFIWIKTHHYSNGEAFGILALVDWVDQGILTHALGSLRAYEKNPSLRIETADEQPLLVIESDACDPDCHRVVQLSPLINREFVDWPLRSESNSCLGRARFSYKESRDIPLDNGLTRRFEVTRRVVFEDDQVYVAERVVADDFNPNEPDKPHDRFRNTDEQRPIVVEDKFIQSSAGDWDYLLETTAMIRPTDK